MPPRQPELQTKHHEVLLNLRDKELYAYMKLRRVQAKMLYLLAVDLLTSNRSTISLAKFNDWMGAAPSFRKRFSEYRGKILDNLIAEINKLTPMNLSLESVRGRNRRITAVRFNSPWLLAKSDLKKRQEEFERNQELLTIVLNCHAMEGDQCVKFKDKAMCELCRKYIVYPLV